MRVTTVDGWGNIGTDILRPPRKRIFLDVDGVLVDFVSAAGRLMNYDPALVTTWEYYPLVGRTKEEFWEIVDAAGSDFWADLEPYPWMRELYEACSERAPTVLLTTPSRCPSSTHGKLRWIQKHFGKSFERYLLGPAKEFCASPGALLIDDADANCDKFEKAGGQSILFPQPWNDNRGLIGTRMAHVMERLGAR